MISENSHLYWSKSLFWGLEIGVDIVLYCIVAQWWWNRPFGVSGFVPYMIIAICIFQCHRELGKLDANITFAELLLAGVCSGASGSLIVDLYAAIYVKAYDPSFMEQMVEQSVELATQLGYADGDMAEGARSVFVPVLMVSTTLVYAFVSLIMSAFGAFLINLRKKHNKGNNSKQQQ